jgi:arylsulfatase A-like enzyme
LPWAWAGLLLALWLAACAGEAPRPRSVVLVVVDTLRADHLGVYGYERPTSPALDRRAAGAAVFERAWSTSPWTLPSFGSLYTGQLPSRHAAGLLRPGGGERSFAYLDESAASIGEILAERGFATAAVVNNPFLHPAFGLGRGFETWDYVFVNYAEYPRASRIVHWGLRWLDARDERPFLLVLHIFDPHLSYDPPPQVRGRFTSGYAGRLALPLTGFGERNATWKPRARADRRFVVGAYDEELLFVDRQIGRLFDELELRGLLEETLVVLTSDHGEELFDHDGFEHGHTMYQELLRVPLLFWGPGVRPGRIETPVSLVDVLPTLLDALGIEPVPGLAGRSLWSLLRGGSEPAERALLAEGTLHGPDRKALVRWPWKLIVTAGQPARLYDLARDAGEQRDLARQEPERLAALLEELETRTRAASRGRAAPSPAQLDEATRAQLSELGYLE